MVLKYHQMRFSRANKLLDEQLSAWRNRPFEVFSYVYLDARYEKVRSGGVVLSCGVLIAVGVDATGNRQVLGTSVKLTEHEVHWAETVPLEGFTVFTMPSRHRKKLRSVNTVERLNEEIKRRTRVATIFPNVEVCLRLVTAVAMEISDDWEGAGRKYLQMDEFQTFCLESRRRRLSVIVTFRFCAGR